MAQEPPVNDRPLCYCPYCGNPVEYQQRYGLDRAVCPACGWIHFQDPKVAVATLIFQDGQVLLTRRVNEPYRGCWTLPAGFVNAHEDPAEAAVRECLEETGYTVLPGSLAAVCEEICEDPGFRRSYPEYAHKMYHIFLCTLAHDRRVEPTETDSMQLATEWIPVDTLESIRLLPDSLRRGIGSVLRGGPPAFLGSEHISYNHG